MVLMLERAGLDPTAVIGGRLSAFGSNAVWTGLLHGRRGGRATGRFSLSPTTALVTNIDREHLEVRRPGERVVDAFAAFADRGRSTDRSSPASTARRWPRCCRG
jgi:UDP-N-acetylmuramate--alanine ligase